MSDGLTEAMRGLKPREYNSPIVKELINETSKEELNKIDKQMTYEMPDPKMHKIYSFIKSAIRISGYIIIPFDLTIASIILILSEVVGILEETV